MKTSPSIKARVRDDYCVGSRVACPGSTLPFFRLARVSLILLLCNELSAIGAEPALRIQPAGEGIMVSWPASFHSFRLEENVDLRNSYHWEPVKTLPQLRNGTYSVFFEKALRNT